MSGALPAAGSGGPPAATPRGHSRAPLTGRLPKDQQEQTGRGVPSAQGMQFTPQHRQAEGRGT